MLNYNLRIVQCVKSMNVIHLHKKLLVQTDILIGTKLSSFEKIREKVETQIDNRLLPDSVGITRCRINNGLMLKDYINRI